MEDLAVNTAENVEFKAVLGFTLRDGERRPTAREERLSTNHICKWFLDWNLNDIMELEQEEEEEEG